MAPVPNRMEVNAAIEKLIARSVDSEVAARTVIQYGDILKPSSRLQIEAASTKTTKGPGIFGYSPGHGNVTIEDKEKEETKEFVFGVHKDRVGHYRVWKEGSGLLCFHYFWKSGLVTRGYGSDGPDTYRLGYNPDSLEPVFLGLERRRVILSLGPVSLEVKYLEPLLGTISKPVCGYGIVVG